MALAYIQERYTQEVLDAAREIRISSEREQAAAIRKLAAHVKEPLLATVFETAYSWTNDLQWADALKELSCWLAVQGCSIEAEALIDRISYRYTEIRVEALANILPHLTELRRMPVFRGMLSGLEDVRYSALGEKKTRKKALRSLAEFLSRVEYQDLYRVWCEGLHKFASQERKDLLLDLQEFAPLILALGGKQAVEETMKIISDVSGCFP